jgi:hypothetical protein
VCLGYVGAVGVKHSRALLMSVPICRKKRGAKVVVDPEPPVSSCAERMLVLLPSVDV